jgi:hypothetical protein
MADPGIHGALYREEDGSPPYNPVFLISSVPEMTG